ncbi:hypothetical protein O3M35_001438 [Rhynocoris fuscipes]|uniref:Uncharacterized protein n=1 Tax=Rhynocoris fuscipes TaxID=488301 RepID=A0AAW1CMH1_9HEMI
MDNWESRAKTWEGEDEDDSVKEAWDQDSEPEAEERKQPVVTNTQQSQPAGSKKSLKKICKRFEEKERQREEEAKARRERLKAELAALPCNTAAERARRRRLQEAADLTLAKEVFGINEKSIRPSS